MLIAICLLIAIDCIAAAYLLCRWLSKRQKQLLKKDIQWFLDEAYDRFHDDAGGDIQYCPYCGTKLSDPTDGKCQKCGRQFRW